MKNFFKKIAFVLALALVFSNIAPVASASAAAVPSLKYTSKVLYVGGDETGKYTDSCWTPSQNHAGYKVSYSTKSPYITVASNGKITATGLGIGKAVVTVTYSKAGTPDIVKGFTVKVRRNATDVRLTNAAIAKIENAINLGATLDLQAAKSISGKSYAKGNYGLDNYMGVCSDQLELVSSDENIIKVNGMSIEAVGVGVATLTVQATQYLQPDVKTKSKDYEVTVIGGLESVAILGYNKVKLSFASPVNKDEVKNGTIALHNNTTNQEVTNYIKSVSYSEDLKTVELETYVTFADKSSYTFTVDGISAQVTAALGEVAKIVITGPVYVTYNTPTALTYKLYDANDVEVERDLRNVHLSLVDLSNTAWIEGDWVTGDEIVIPEVNQSVKVVATYGEGKYDENNKLIEVKSEPFTVTSVEDADAAMIKAFVDAVVSTSQGSSATFNGSMKVPAETSNAFKLVVKAVRTDNATFYSGTYDSSIRFESNNKEKLYVNTITGELTPLPAAVVGEKIGVSVRCGNVQHVYDVIIGEKEVITRLSYDTALITLSNLDGVDGAAEAALEPIEAEKAIKVWAVTNYETKMSLNNKLYSFEADRSNTKVLTSVTDALSSDNKDYVITFNAKDAAPGTYKYNVTIEGKIITGLTVKVLDSTVATTGSAVTYRFVTENTNPDAKVTDSTDSTSSDFKVYAVAYNRLGAAVNIVTGASYTIKNEKGSIVYSSNVTGEAVQNTGGYEVTTDDLGGNTFGNGFITVSPVSGSMAANDGNVSINDSFASIKLPTGRYTVEGYLHQDNRIGLWTTENLSGTAIVRKPIATTTYVLKDTQALPTVDLANNGLLKRGDDDIKNCFTVKLSDTNRTVVTDYDVEAIGLSNDTRIDFTSNGIIVMYDSKPGSYDILVKSITVTETFGSNQVKHKVPVNKVITFVRQE